MQSTEFLAGQVDGGLDGIPVPHVAGNETDLVTAPLGQGLALAGIDIGHDHAGPAG